MKGQGGRAFLGFGSACLQVCGCTRPRDVRLDRRCDRLKDGPCPRNGQRGCMKVRHSCESSQSIYSFLIFSQIFPLGRRHKQDQPAKHQQKCSQTSPSTPRRRPPDHNHNTTTIPPQRTTLPPPPAHPASPPPPPAAPRPPAHRATKPLRNPTSTSPSRTLRTNSMPTASTTANRAMRTRTPDVKPIARRHRRHTKTTTSGRCSKRTGYGCRVPR